MYSVSQSLSIPTRLCLKGPFFRTISGLIYEYHHDPSHVNECNLIPDYLETFCTQFGTSSLSHVDNLTEALDWFKMSRRDHHYADLLVRSADIHLKWTLKKYRSFEDKMNHSFVN